MTVTYELVLTPSQVSWWECSLHFTFCLPLHIISLHQDVLYVYNIFNNLVFLNGFNAIKRSLQAVTCSTELRAFAVQPKISNI
jgi:hypothetical protein